MTTLPTSLDFIIEGVKALLPSVSVKYDEPLNPDGTWFIDFTGRFHGVVVLQYSITGVTLYDAQADMDVETAQDSQSVIDTILAVLLQ